VAGQAFEDAEDESVRVPGGEVGASHGSLHFVSRMAVLIEAQRRAASGLKF
jgi:hypothetical protein